MPHIDEYFAFVKDKSLFFYTDSGNVVVSAEMSTAVAKMYIYTYWHDLIDKGNSPSSIWNIFNSINNMNGVLTFDPNGYQISHPSMLDLDRSQFVGLMAKSLYSDVWLLWLRIVFAILVTVVGIIYFGRKAISETTPASRWERLLGAARVDLLL